MTQSTSQRIVDAMPYLDAVSDAVQPKVREAVEKGGDEVRDVLDGIPVLGVPLHPALTDVPVGAWTAAVIFDVAEMASGSRAMRNAADASLAVGVAGGFLAALPGLSDWGEVEEGAPRRMGIAHGLLNVAGLGLNTASLMLRASGRRSAGRWVFFAGYAVSGTATHLGGELTYRHGVRVSHGESAGEDAPTAFTRVASEDDLPEDGLLGVRVNDERVLLSRVGGEVCAISAVCTHQGGPLEQGTREGNTVVCPWHQGRFDLCSGEVLSAPPQSSVAHRYETRVRNGNVEIRAATAG